MKRSSDVTEPHNAVDVGTLNDHRASFPELRLNVGEIEQLEKRRLILRSPDAVPDADPIRP